MLPKLNSTPLSICGHMGGVGVHILMEMARDKTRGVRDVECLTGTQLSNGIPHGVQCSGAKRGMAVEYGGEVYIPQ